MGNRDDDVRAAVARLHSLLSQQEEEDLGPTFGEVWEQRVRAEEIKNPGWAYMYRYRIRAPLFWFGLWPASLVTPAAWLEFRNARCGPTFSNGCGLSAFTANLELDLFKATMYWAEDNGIIRQNPAARIKRERARSQPQPPAKEEHTERMLRAFKDDLARAYYLTGLDAGPRQNEIRHIRRCDINSETREIHLEVTKGDKPRVVVVTARTIEAWKRVPDHPGTPYLLVNPGTGALFTNRTLGRWVAMAAKRSGVDLEYQGRKKPRSHALRRGYATNAIARGVPITSVRDQLGHESLAQTEKYIEGDITHLHEAAQIFEDGIAKRKGPHRAPPPTGAADPGAISLDPRIGSCA